MRRICAVARRACRGPLPLRCMSQGQAPVSAASATVDPAEIAKFGRLASQWWDADGVFAGLHSMNAVRVPIIRQAAGAPLTVPDVPKPLHGVSIADIGCGGGILAEALGRLGATVTAVDASKDNVAVANHHAASSGSGVAYVCATAEDLVAHGRHYDVVVASDVLEHVLEQEAFVHACCALVKPGGSFVCTTINKGPVATVLGVWLAEYCAGLVPVGTHDPSKFVSPAQLGRMIASAPGGMTVTRTLGLLFNPLTKTWSTHPQNTLVNYAVVAVKAPVAAAPPPAQ